MRRILLGALTIAGVLAPVGGAQARSDPPDLRSLSPGAPTDRLIVPLDSVGAVSIGMSSAAVQRALGVPRQRYGVPVHWFYPRLGLDVEFSLTDPVSATDTVDALSVLNGRGGYQTASGLGIGSTAAAVRRTYPHTRFQIEGYTITQRHGDLVRSTTFNTITRTGHVSQIFVALSDDPVSRVTRRRVP